MKQNSLLEKGRSKPVDLNSCTRFCAMAYEKGLFLLIFLVYSPNTSESRILSRLNESTPAFRTECTLELIQEHIENGLTIVALPQHGTNDKNRFKEESEIVEELFGYMSTTIEVKTARTKVLNRVITSLCTPSNCVIDIPFLFCFIATGRLNHASLVVFDFS